MPPTVATNSTVHREKSSRNKKVSNRTSSASSLTTRRSQSTLIENKDANNGRKDASAPRYKLMNCQVVVQDVLAQKISSKELSRNEKDCSSVIHIDISAKDDDISVVPIQHRQIITVRNNNVTRRTKSRVTKNNTNPNSSVEKQRHTINIVPSEQYTIINLDDSCDSTTRRKKIPRNTRSVAELPDQSAIRKQTQTSTTIDVIQVDDDVANSEEQRSKECNLGEQNYASSRSATKRKTDSIIPLRESGVSPPKRSSGVAVPIAEPMTNEATSATIAKENLTEGVEERNTTAIERRLENVDNGAFKSLIILVKRIAPALSEVDLKRLKYPELDSTQDTTAPQRSSIPATKRQSNNATQEPRTLPRQKSTTVKPQIVISSRIIEVPESPPPAVDKKLLNASKLSNTQSNTFKVPLPPNLPHLKQIENKSLNTQKPSNTYKKPTPTARLPRLPLLMEEENEDVYDFLSSSQNSDTSTSNETTRKPKRKKVKKPVNKKQKPAGGTKAKVKQEKSKNPFGFNNKALQKVIKNIGGGPVKQPDKMDYKINLELPKTPPVVAPTPTVIPSVDLLTNNMELHFDDQSSHLEASRILHPTMERLKPNRLQELLTSTPVHKTNPAKGPNVTSIKANPPSPWRVQNEMIIPRTSYVYRTNDMLPSYESFTNGNENVPVKSAAKNVTERRKSSPTGTLANLADVSHDEMISDKDIKEIEQRYRELKAMSEMGEKLITAMRRCEKKGVTPQQDQNMRLARQKLKKWYERSMQAFSIISNIQRANNSITERARASPSPLLSQEQQRTIENFNLSTDRFRSMIDDLQLTINDSDIENRPPPVASKVDGKVVTQSEGKGSNAQGVSQSKHPKDVVILPDRGTPASRNPLMPLNVVPLPLRDSPLMSPLAKKSPAGNAPEESIRRELQYDKANDSFGTNTARKQQQENDVGQSKAQAAPSACSVVEIFDETTDNGSVLHDDDDDDDAHHSNEDVPDNPTHDYFGFDDDIGSVVESSVAQVTLPNPLNISNRTLQKRLQTAKQLLPKRPIFRSQPKRLQTRSSGPTRFPAKNLRVFTSPTKRPHTLHDFVASTPRPGESSTAAGPSASLRPFALDAPDVSAIEPIIEVPDAETDVVLFDTPDRPAWLNNSAHQRTYARVPKLRKKKNIYLANLGLDDDEEDEDSVQELSSDSEMDEGKGKKKKKQKKKPLPVEETNDFKAFVDNFNSMCEEVERYELIVE